MRLAGAVSLAVLTTSGLSHIAVGGLGHAITRVDPFTGLGRRPAVGAGQNFLLVGTDGRDRIGERDRERYRLGGEPCHCTDTMMLLHLSADRSRLSVVGIPRDTYVELPAPHGGRPRPAKLNAAYAVGGPGLTVRTVERLTGVRVDHYLELDFTSFMRTVDAVGGVPVCTARPLHDPKSGLELPAGTTVLDGGRALQYVRSRYLDGSADLGRMQRQQRFVAQLIHRATGSGVLLNPVRLSTTIGSALSSVRADKGLTTTDLLDLAGTVRGFTPASAEFASVPVAEADHQVPGVGSTVRWDRRRAERLFAAVRRDEPLAAAREEREHDGAPGPGTRAPGGVRSAAASGPGRPHDPARPRVPVPVDPATVTVQVMTDGPRGRLVADELRATGFRVVSAPHRRLWWTPPHTVIDYDPGRIRSARSLAAALPGAEPRPQEGLGAVLRVTAGEDFAGVTPVRPDNPAPRVNPATGVGAVTGDQVVCP
ncbi:putative transcriptional regulator [Streptantibioticus cattleyicolor NRRL 8057 = DSM 46488]|nr:LytR family transcriptional regulator [Streptomyces sp. SID5468]CCB74764.1 putative transcriptional regulator [Streptantibioticus cattleyicolor NRRL 8057 = DSM 46488]